MERQILNIELRGPCGNSTGLYPHMGDTVARVEGDGRLQFITIAGHVSGDLYRDELGRGFFITDCYLLYKGTEKGSFDDEVLNTDNHFPSSKPIC